MNLCTLYYWEGERRNQSRLGTVLKGEGLYIEVVNQKERGFDEHGRQLIRQEKFPRLTRRDFLFETTDRGHWLTLRSSLLTSC